MGAAFAGNTIFSSLLHIHEREASGDVLQSWTTVDLNMYLRWVICEKTLSTLDKNNAPSSYFSSCVTIDLILNIYLFDRH